MFINESTHVIILSKESNEFKLDMVQVGGAIMHFHTENGGKIKMAQDGKNVYIRVEDPTPEAWTQIVADIKEWSILRKRVLLYEKQKREKARDQKNDDFLKWLKGFGKR